MEGWFKFERKWLENGVINRDSDHLAIWIYLHAHAVFEPCQTMFGKDPMVLQPGQLITGRRVLAQTLNLTESHVTRILNQFQRAGLIEQKTTPFARLITLSDTDIESICKRKSQKSEQPLNADQSPNDGAFQGSFEKSEQQANNERTTNGQQANNKRTTSGQQANTYKECKNDKNERMQKKRAFARETQRRLESVFSSDASYDLAAFEQRAIGLHDFVPPVTAPSPESDAREPLPPPDETAWSRDCAHPLPPA